MIINPFFALLSVYIAGNFYALIAGLNQGGFFAFGIFNEIHPLSFILSFFIQLIFLSSIVAFYFYGVVNYKKQIFLDNFYGYVLLILKIFFLIFFLVTGSGRAGSAFEFEEPSLVNYFFVLTQPDLLYFIVAIFLKSTRLFFAISLLFLISLLLRGWMGAVLFLAIAFLVRFYPYRLAAKNLPFFILFFIVLVGLLPILDSIKWSMRVHMSAPEFFANLFLMNYLEVFPVVVQSVVDRFSHINHVAYVLENSSALWSSLVNGNFSWFFNAGIPRALYCFIYDCPSEISVYLAEQLSGLPNLTWNVDVGAAGWLVVLGVYSSILIIFVFILLFFGVTIFGSLYGFNGVLLFAILSLIYLFHGWIGAFINVVLYGFIFYFIAFYFSGKSSKNFLNVKRPAGSYN